MNDGVWQVLALVFAVLGAALITYAVTREVARRRLPEPEVIERFVGVDVASGEVTVAVCYRHPDGSIHVESVETYPRCDADDKPPVGEKAEQVWSDEPFPKKGRAW